MLKRNYEPIIIDLRLEIIFMRTEIYKFSFTQLIEMGAMFQHICPPSGLQTLECMSKVLYYGGSTDSLHG
jgi:hypothetical protein